MLITAIATQTKFLCCCESGESHCPYCLGLPGALPLPNRAAFDAALEVAKQLNMTALERADFVRTPDAAAQRGWRVATTPIAMSPQGKLWLEEDARGRALLCIGGTIKPDALGSALQAAGVRGGPIRSPAVEQKEIWHPYVDLPGVFL